LSIIQTMVQYKNTSSLWIQYSLVILLAILSNLRITLLQ